MIPINRNSTRGLGNRKFAGFTLVELMIAIAILGLTLVAAYGGLRSGTKAWTVGEERAARNEQLRVLQSFLRRQLSQIVPLVWSSAGKQSLWFRGDPAAMVFAAQVPSRSLNEGLTLMRLTQRENENGHQLTIGCIRAHPDNIVKVFVTRGPDQCKRVAVLLDKVANLEFAYWGKRNQRSNPQWQTKWRSKSKLPTAIRMRITPANASRAWPEIIVPLHVTAQPGERQLEMHKPGQAGSDADPLEGDAEFDADELDNDAEDPDGALDGEAEY